MTNLVGLLCSRDLSDFVDSIDDAAKEKASKHIEKIKDRLDTENCWTETLRKMVFDTAYLLSPDKLPFEKELQTWLAPNIQLHTFSTGNNPQDIIADLINKDKKTNWGLLTSESLQLESIPEKLKEHITVTYPNSTDTQNKATLKLCKPAGFENFIGSSQITAAMLNRANIAANHTEKSVLITGAPGTGKKLLAKAIAKQGSPEGTVKNIVFYDNSLPETDSPENNEGFEFLKNSNDGVVVLENINKCPQHTQIILLSIMRSRTPTQASPPRIIATSSENLLELVSKGIFFEELYYLLAEITIQTTPLRERAKDLPVLAHYFLKRINKKPSSPISEYKTFSKEARAALLKYAWPGNIRELEHKIQQAVIFTENKEIEASDLFQNYPPFKSRQQILKKGFKLKDELEKMEKYYINAALKQTGHNKRAASELLGLNNYQSLDSKLTKLGLEYPKRKRTITPPEQESESSKKQS
jgi:DNA-binding NtrC family response regulator